MPVGCNLVVLTFSMLLQFAPAPPPYCCDSIDQIGGSGISHKSGPSLRHSIASQRAQEGQGVAAAMRQHAPLASTGGDASQSEGDAVGSRGTRSRTLGNDVLGQDTVQARPPTGPAQQRRYQYPWTWET
jgi:hypothetical protein